MDELKLEVKKVFKHCDQYCRDLNIVDKHFRCQMFFTFFPRTAYFEHLYWVEACLSYQKCEKYKQYKRSYEVNYRKTNRAERNFDAYVSIFQNEPKRIQEYAEKKKLVHRLNKWRIRHGG